MDYLFSIHSSHVKRIFAGQKSVELRKRRLKLEIPSRLWIYETSPVMSVVGHTTIDDVVSDEPQKIWNAYKSKICINENFYWEYIGQSNCATAILLSGPKLLKKPIRLPSIRDQIPRFHPPQFYCKMSAYGPSDWLLSKLQLTKS